MSCRVPRAGALRRFSLLSPVLSAVALLLSLAQSAQAFNAVSLGDFDNVTVMEVSGDFAAVDAYGRANLEPRRVIAREFYRSHGDDYDFLVIFTNFDFVMPPGVKAFFSAARNDVRGIGLGLYDHTGTYSPLGMPLARLQGTIDMAALASHVLEPTHPGFEKTLLALTHEFMHRWGAYVRFRDGAGESSALLGPGGAHWSFLLDSEGSALYGNNWHDNGDGTFTSIAPGQARAGEVIGRLFSPLELYLMGLADKSRVPPMLLIDAPGFDPAQMPQVGMTIPGAAKTVTIDDIIAAEGERTPSVADARKEFRMAFIYAVMPGSWDENSARDRGDLAAINRLQGEWDKRFTILTGGMALMQSAIMEQPAVAANPGITTPAIVPAGTPCVDSGVDWLIGQQQADGSWCDRADTGARDTAAAVSALKLFPDGAAAVTAGQRWLETAAPVNNDFFSRRLLGLDNADTSELLARQNLDGGWGSAPGFLSTPVDTALSLRVLSAHGGTAAAALSAAVDYLHGRQNPDGGWSMGDGGSLVLPTAQVLLALNDLRGRFPIEPEIADGLAWLLLQQHSDGCFGSSPGPVIDTALALQACKAAGAPPEAVADAVTYLLSRQGDTGSWNGSVFHTALAVAALHAALVAPDLVVYEADISFSPAVIAAVPATLGVTVTVRNLGSRTAPAVGVALFEGDPVLGRLLERQVVDVPGNGSTSAAFTVSVNEAGLHAYHVIIDDAGSIVESNERNNSASRTVAASMAPPSAGFALSTSAGPEAQGSAELTVILSHPWPEPITVSYSMSSVGTAIPAADYRLDDERLEFAANETVKSIGVAIVNDLVAEIDKTVVVDLMTPSIGTLGISRHIYTIQDDEAPMLSIDSPPAGLVGESNPLLRYSTTGSGVVVKVDGLVASAVSGENLGPLPDGAHALEVTAVNSLGMATTSRIDFTVDTALPAVTIHSPRSDTVSGPRPLLDYALASVARLEVLVDAVPVSAASGASLGPLADGFHTLTINAWNTAGAKISSQVVFQVDARPPRVEILYPENAFIRDANPGLRYRTDEGGEVVVWLDGIEKAVREGEGLGPLDGGTHRLRVAVTDAVGNTGSAETIFSVAVGDEGAFTFVPGWPQVVEGSYGGMAADRSGNFIVVTRRTAKEFDIFKFDAAGQLLWRVIRSSQFNVIGSHWVDLEPKDVAIDSRGNIYVVGWGFDSPRYYSFLAKYDRDGRYLQHVLLDTGMLYGDIQAYSVHVDESDRIYVSGNTDNNLFSENYRESATIFVAKYNQSLGRLYGRCFGDPYDTASFYFTSRDSMTVDGEQNVWIAGKSGGNRLLVWKLAPDLTRTGIEIVGAGNASGMDIASDPSGTIHVAGLSLAGGTVWRYAAEDGRPLAERGLVSSVSLTSLAVNGDGTMFVVDEAGTLRKLDRNLELLWTTPLAGDLDSKLVPAMAGRLFVGGSDNSLRAAAIAALSDPRIPRFNFKQPVFHSNTGTVVLEGTLDHGFEVALDNDDYELTTYQHDAGSGCWQMAVSGLAEGEHRLAVSVTGDDGFAQHYETVAVVDTTAPRVLIGMPADGSRWTNRPWLNYTVSEGVARVFVNGVEVTKGSGSQLDSLRPGENRIRVQSSDAAGNVGFAEIVVEASGTAIGEYPLDIETMRLTGTAGDQTVVDTGEDASGNLYLFGDTARPPAGSADRQMYVAKYDPAGTLVSFWPIAGSVYDDYAVALAVAPGGEFAIAYLTRQPNDLSVNAMTVAGFAANGTQRWSDRMSSGSYEEIRGLTLDAAGNVYACGYTTGRLHNKRFGGKEDYFLIKYTPQGSRLWTVLSNLPTYDALNDIAFGADGFLYGVGRMTDMPAMTLFKFNMDGTLLWSRDYTYPNNLMRVRQMELGSDGSFYTFIELQDSAVNYSYYVTRHDPRGNFVNGVYGQKPSVRGLGLSLDAASNVYMTGFSDDPYGWGWSLGGNRSFGARDIFIVKYAAADLRVLWSRQAGDARNQEGSRVVYSRTNGRFYLAGVGDADFAGAESGSRDPFLLPLRQLAEHQAPALSVADYQSPTRHRLQVISGRATPGTVVAAAVAAPAASSARLSPVAQYPDGSWTFTVDNLAENTDNIVTVSAADASGTTRQSITITVDTIPPVLTVDPVESPTDLSAQLITGQVETGAVLTMPGCPVTVANGIWSCAVENLRGGDNVFTLTATDGVGNRTTRSVTITYVPPPPPTLEIVPAVISADQAVDVVLAIAGVSPPGATVRVVQTLDLDGNGRADALEPVVRRFAVTDGVAQASPEIVSDTDGKVDGSAVARLNFRFVNDRYHAVGPYLFTVEAATGCAVRSFQVIAAGKPQCLAGKLSSIEGTPMGGALVELLDPWGRSHGFAMTDADGRYRFDIARPGDYLPVPMAEGVVFDRGTALPVAVAPGQTALRDLVMTSGPRRVEGTVRDAVTGSGLPGVTVRAESSRYLAAGMTADDGGYVLLLPDGEYDLTVETRPGDGLAAHGGIGTDGSLRKLKVAADLTGQDVTVEKGEHLVCGSVVDAVNLGIAGVPVLATAVDGSGRMAEACSAERGRYCAALSTGNAWQLWPNGQSAYGVGLVGTAAGTLDPDLTAYPIDAWIDGTLRDSTGQPIAGVTVDVGHDAGAGSAVATTRDGRYLLGISTALQGNWLVSVHGEEAGFAPVPPVSLTPASDQTATRDFILSRARANSIVITKAAYDSRKKVLTVEASSNYDNAQLQVVDYGPMTFSRLAKGKYYWTFSRGVAAKPATVTVSGPEGSNTATVL